MRAVLVAGLLVAGCATRHETRSPVFYPPPPAEARIQYLTTFSSAADLPGRRVGFARFVLGRETAAPAIRKPYGVAMHDGRLYVVDTRGPGYTVFDFPQRSLHLVSGSGAARMKKPVNIAVDGDGTKYVCDTGLDQILVFDVKDRFVRAYEVPGPFRPGAVAIDGERLYVTDLERHQVHVLDKASGRTLRSFGKAGSKDGEFFFPTNLAVGPGGTLYVTDTGNFRVQVFTPDGEFVRSFGGIGNALGRFARPKGIAVDREGRTYVVDAAFDNVQVFDPEGKLLLFFGQAGPEPEDVSLPAAVAIDYASVHFFQRYAAPGFTLEYVILVSSQFGPGKVNVYGFGARAAPPETP